MELERTLKMPLDDPNWLVKVLIGGGLTLIPIVNLLSHGYALEVMRRTITGRSGLPEWEDWGDKFVMGLMALVISLVYYIPVLIIMGVGGGFGALGLVPGHTGFSGLGLFFIVGSFAIGSILLLVIGFVVPMALAHYLATGRVGAALSLGTILGKIGQSISDYIVAYVITLVMLVLVGIVAGTPIIGWLLSAFLYFYGLIVISVLFGRIYACTA